MTKADYVMGNGPKYPDELKFVDYSRKVSNDVADRLYRNSVTVKEEKNYQEAKHQFRKGVAVGTTISLVVATATLCLALAGRSIRDKTTLSNFEKAYHDTVENNTHYTSDHQSIWYDTEALAEYVLSQDNSTLALYGVIENTNLRLYADDIGAVDKPGTKLHTANEIIKDMSMIVQENPDVYGNCVSYSGLNDFLIKNNFVDAEGKPSYAKWQEAMDNYILGSTKEEFLPMKDLFRSYEDTKGAK